jgi:hypothetical protein
MLMYVENGKKAKRKNEILLEERERTEKKKH